jgi:prepilin-type N-terminal cleavage/methylation domain-containing protein
LRALTSRLAVRLSREDGFGLVELLMSMTIFAIVSAPLAGVLLASVSQQKLSKERTLAGETAQSAIEGIRALPYGSVGLQNGNPTGNLLPSQPASAYGIGGLDATVTTRISYMDDAPATSYRTRADYKRVIVTVTRNGDGRRLTQAATFVAPPGGGAYAGQNEGIVLAQVIDYVLNTPLVGANVQITGGPSPTRNDTSDASGSVVFPSLTPTTVSQPAYGLTVGATGYQTLREDSPPSNTAQSAIVGGQTFQTVLRVYKPSTITIVAKNANGTSYTGAATATVSSTRGSQSFALNGGQLQVPSINGELVVPNVQYTARILASNGMYSTPVTALVPNAYPTDNTKTFTLPLGGTAATMVTLTVHVQKSGNVKQVGATVNVSGGPGSNILLTGTTNSGGDAVFTVPANSSPGYSVTATNGTLSGSSASAGVTATTTRTVTVS